MSQAARRKRFLALDFRKITTHVTFFFLTCFSYLHEHTAQDSQDGGVRRAQIRAIPLDGRRLGRGGSLSVGAAPDRRPRVRT